MGFLKFLKKEKSSDQELSADDLDAPPLPPDSGLDDDVGKFPDLPKLPSLDAEPENIDKQDMDDFSWDRPVSDIDISMGQEKENIAEKPIEAPPLPEELIAKPEALKQVEPLKPKIPKTPVKQKSQIEKEEAESYVDHSLFMRVDMFKHTIKDIHDLKSSLKRANFSMQTVTSIDDSLSKRMYKWRAQMLDMQKKMMFIEQTIFKGDK